MTPEERKAFADAADDAIVHPLVEQVIEEDRQNMRSEGVAVERGTVAQWGLFKCLNAAVQVARAQALGIDPSDLIMTRHVPTAKACGLAPVGSSLVFSEALQSSTQLNHGPLGRMKDAPRRAITRAPFISASTVRPQR